MARSHPNQRFIAFGEIGLHVIELFHVLSDALIVVFFLEVDNSAEVGSIGPVFSFLGAEIDGVTLVVIVEGVDTSRDVFNHGVSEGVVSVFSIHFDDAKVAIELPIKIEDALELSIAQIVSVDD